MQESSLPTLVLYPDPMVPLIPSDGRWNSFGDHLPYAWAAAWLDAFDGYDYGTLTAYLMRAHGYPNIPGGDPFGHGHCWGLASPRGLLLCVEPRPIQLLNYRLQPPAERGRMVEALANAQVFSFSPVSLSPENLTPDLLNHFIFEFRRPVYVGDMGFHAQGLLPESDDVGPGAETVKNLGARSINVVFPPPLLLMDQLDHAPGKMAVVDRLYTRMLARSGVISREDPSAPSNSRHA
jgi:hypothetical protein